MVEKKLNISKFFKEKYGKGDFSIIDDKLVYETKKGDIIEANLPESNKFIENKTKKEVMDMKHKKEDLETVSEANMKANYVKLTESHSTPDPEVMEADKKHIDMTKEPKKLDESQDAEEAGEMEAETPNEGKKKKVAADFQEEILKTLKSMQEDMVSVKAENEKLRKEITDMNSEKIVEKQLKQESLIADMSDKYMVPKAWLKEKADKYKDTEAFIQDFYEGLSFAFGILPEHEVNEWKKKEDMNENSLLVSIEGLGDDVRY